MNPLITPILVFQLYLIYTGTRCAKNKGYSPLIGFFASVSVVGAIYFIFAPSAVAAELDEPTKSRRKNAGNAIGVVIAMVAILATAYLLGGPPKWLAIFETKSVKQAHALLSDSPYHELPKSVVIKIHKEGSASFQKGDKSYDDLISLLHNGHTPEMLNKVGKDNVNNMSAVLGELVISNYGIASRFMICTTRTTDVFSIQLPTLDKMGYYEDVLFTADPRVIELINETAIMLPGRLKPAIVH